MIVTELVKIQNQRGLTDSQMAESLGIHKISWYRNKRTNIISAEVLLKAFSIYPELKESFLASFEKPYEKRHNPNLGVFWGRMGKTIKSLF